LPGGIKEELPLYQTASLSKEGYVTLLKSAPRGTRLSKEEVNYLTNSEREEQPVGGPLIQARRTREGRGLVKIARKSDSHAAVYPVNTIMEDTDFAVSLHKHSRKRRNKSTRMLKAAIKKFEVRKNESPEKHLERLIQYQETLKLQSRSKTRNGNLTILQNNSGSRFAAFKNTQVIEYEKRLEEGIRSVKSRVVRRRRNREGVDHKFLRKETIKSLNRKRGITSEFLEECVAKSMES